MFVLLVIIIVAYLVYRGNELGYFDKFLQKKLEIIIEPTKKITTLSGYVEMPVHDERIRAYTESRARGETNEGGGVDHGFYLEGLFEIFVDGNNNLSGNLILHGNNAQVLGGQLNLDGTFFGSHIGGPFEGKIVGDKVTGMVFEGGGREYLQETADKNSKIPFIFGRFVGLAS